MARPEDAAAFDREWRMLNEQTTQKGSQMSKLENRMAAIESEVEQAQAQRSRLEALETERDALQEQAEQGRHPQQCVTEFSEDMTDPQVWIDRPRQADRIPRKAKTGRLPTVQ